MSLRRFSFVHRVFPVWWRPHAGAWHLSRGPVQYVSQAAFEAPGRYPVSVALAAVAAAQFYLATSVVVVLGGLALLISASFVIGLFCGLALLAFISRRALRAHWLAVRYALALNMTGGQLNALFYAKHIAEETGLDRGAARALLEDWLINTSKGSF